jgi:hypothetical protein
LAAPLSVSDFEQAVDDRRIVNDERPLTVTGWKRWRRDRTNQVASQPLDSVTHAVGPAIDETARAYGTARQLCNTGVAQEYRDCSGSVASRANGLTVEVQSLQTLGEALAATHRVAAIESDLLSEADNAGWATSCHE